MSLVCVRILHRSSFPYRLSKLALVATDSHRLHEAEGVHARVRHACWRASAHTARTGTCALQRHSTRVAGYMTITCPDSARMTSSTLAGSLASENVSSELHGGAHPIPRFANRRETYICNGGEAGLGCVWGCDSDRLWLGWLVQGELVVCAM